MTPLRRSAFGQSAFLLWEQLTHETARQHISETVTHIGTQSSMWVPEESFALFHEISCVHVKCALTHAKVCFSQNGCHQTCCGT